MIYIIHIPLFYQSSYYPFPTTSNLPTTTATSIAIPCNSPEAQAIFNDCKSWGWNVEHTHLDTLARKEWWANYVKKRRNKRWEDDVWRIWQREHGVRILKRDEELKGEQGQSMSGVQRAVSEVKKVGRWVRRNTVVRESTEAELRGLEEAKTRAREGMRRQAELQAQASTMSLPGSVVERLESMRVRIRVSEPGFDDSSSSKLHK
ncbi:Nn.00g113770.m01.CDS01 [Neocucurbitaria sp. VM-36]